MIRAARFAMRGRHHNIESWAAASSCWKKVASRQPKDWKKVATKPYKGWGKVATTMLKRKIINKLEAWKKTIANKALLIKGARQVGKTTVVRQFAKAAAWHIVSQRRQHISIFPY